MINPTISFKTDKLKILTQDKKLIAHLHTASEKSLSIMLRTLRHNCPVGRRPARETHPGEPRMKNAIFAKRYKEPGFFGGSVYIDTKICPHAYYYTYGRRGGSLIFPKHKKALTIVKRWMTKSEAPLRKWSRLGSMRGHTEYLQKTVTEVEPRIRTIFKEAVRVWMGEL